MKRFFLVIGFIIPLSLLAGCQQTTQTENLNAEEDMKDFIEPDSSEWVKYSKIVREYMYYRTQAVVKMIFRFCGNNIRD